MKVIFSIAKNEFRYLFYSPVAWFVLLVFLIQCGLFYSIPVLNAANVQQIMQENTPDFKGFTGSLTQGLFLGTEFFPNIIRNLYLFIPILTMGLISREVTNSTSALLFSSPVNMRKIVLGKYLGIMMYNLILVLIVALFLVVGAFIIHKPDTGNIFSAILGFYLLVSTYSAIGLFMSSLSNYQIVSALGTFTVLFVLSTIGQLWQRYDFVRDLTYFLSLQNRTTKMLFGLVVSKDVIYFITVTVMFVLFTIIRLRNGKESIPWYRKLLRYARVMLVVLAVGYISSRPMLTGYWDSTATQRNTIHPKLQEMLREFKDSTLEVTLYTNLLGKKFERGLPEARNVDYLSNFWEKYTRFKPDIAFKYVYYYEYDPVSDDSVLYKTWPGLDLQGIVKEKADLIDADPSMFRSPEKVRQQVDLGYEFERLVMQLKYKGKTAWLRTFDDPQFWPDQKNMSAALRRLLDPAMPQITYVTGELERSVIKAGEREYRYHSAEREGRGTLVNIGFDVDTVDLRKNEVPPATTVLVLADPKMDLSPVVLGKLKDFVNQGGNMLVTGEPGKQYVLNPFLSELGLQIMDGQLVQPSYDETPDKVKSHLEPPVGNLSAQTAWLKIRTDSVGILTPGVATVISTADKGFKVDTLTRTFTSKTWLKATPLVIDSILPPFNAAEGDRFMPSFNTSLQLTRKINGKDQRVIVVGDADYASNLRLATSSYNVEFLMPGFSWLAYNRFPVDTPEKKAEDTILKIGLKAATFQKTLFVYLLPAAILLAGIILLIRRKRK
ncbi:MAG: Gldg family protein [Chitinophagaceae bacterium]|nr:Gldg family protein [Chitinophagaceae bacterium]